MPTVMEKLKGQIKDQLSDSEFERLERPLELIERDRKIRAEFRRLRNQGVQVTEAIYRLADQSWNGEYLSPSQIDWIIYKRERGKDSGS
jgi:hypothetical protein